MSNRLTNVLNEFHTAQPLRPGIAREVARDRLGIDAPRFFDDLIATAASAGIVIDDGATLRSPAFRMSLEPARRAKADPFVAALRAQPYAPPGPHEFGLDAETSGGPRASR